jgi:hypothetical protein
MWLDIGLHMARGGSKGKMHVIDTDVGVEAAFEFYPELEDVVVHYPVYEFEELQEIVQEIKATKPNARDGDWVVIDMISYLWVEVRAFYTASLYGMSVMEYILETRDLIRQAKAKKQGHEREFGDYSGKDWDAMAKIYHSLELPLTLRSRAHVFATAEERSATKDDRGTDTKTVKAWKRAGGFKPYGHTAMPHHFRTLIRVTNPGDQRNLILAGDRFRERIWEEQNISRDREQTILMMGDVDEGEGFVQTYLRNIAGWRYREKK